jgi:hypothetical protein
MTLDRRIMSVGVNDGASIIGALMVLKDSIEVRAISRRFGRLSSFRANERIPSRPPAPPWTRGRTRSWSSASYPAATGTGPHSDRTRLATCTLTGGGVAQAVWSQLSSIKTAQSL